MTNRVRVTSDDLTKWWGSGRCPQCLGNGFEGIKFSFYANCEYERLCPKCLTRFSIKGGKGYLDIPGKEAFVFELGIYVDASCGECGGSGISIIHHMVGVRATEVCIMCAGKGLVKMWMSGSDMAAGDCVRGRFRNLEKDE